MPGNNYTDYSTIDEDAYVAFNGPINKMKGGVATPFPQKLHKILDEGTHSDIISWAPHGRCFLIHQPKLFVEIVLPNFFHTTKKTSFTRQLNLYGFVRLLSNGRDKGGYYHEKFLRGKSKLCKLIKRIPLKGSDHSFCADSQQEPKFYSMTYLPQISTPVASSGTSFSSASVSSTSTSSCSVETSEISSSKISSSSCLQQLRTNFMKAQAAIDKVSCCQDKAMNIKHIYVTDHLSSSSVLVDGGRFRRESFVPNINEYRMFRRLSLSSLINDERITLNSSELLERKRAPTVTSLKSTFPRNNKEKPSPMSDFDSKTKCFISQFF